LLGANSWQNKSNSAGGNIFLSAWHEVIVPPGHHCGGNIAVVIDSFMQI
jgi:hypothetical protein